MSVDSPNLTPAGVSYTLGRIEAALSAVHADVKEIKSGMLTLDERVRSNEKKTYYLMRVGGVAVTTVTGALAALGFK